MALLHRVPRLIEIEIKVMVPFLILGIATQPNPASREIGPFFYSFGSLFLRNEELLETESTRRLLTNPITRSRL